MTENRNNSPLCNTEGRGTVCIDTHRVLDSCRDRDCYENVRVYLNAFGDETLRAATNVRARSASVLWAYVGVDEVPFNCGFYQINVKYYITVEFEACLGIGRTQSFYGIAVLDKNVVLYGGEGGSTTFTSDGTDDFCRIPDLNNRGTTRPTATVETVEPIILCTKIINDCCCHPKYECHDLPDAIIDYLGGAVNFDNNGPRLYVSLGIFSIIRIVREAQFLIDAQEYTIPDKECNPLSCNEDPCAAFNNLPFPTSRFKGTHIKDDHPPRERRGGCGCNK